MADRRGAPVGRLGVAHVEVVVHEHRAADGRHGDGAVLDAELVDGLGEVLVDQAVTAPGAVVGGVALQPLAVGVALEAREDAHETPPVVAELIAVS
jgi:hypothetical protein